MKIRRDVRERYAFDESLFSRSGHLVLKNVRAAHVFANVFNVDRPDSKKISPAGLNAASIVHDILHLAISDFVDQNDPELFGRVLTDAQSRLGTEGVEHTLEQFTECFPTDEVVQSHTTPTAYLELQTGGIPNRELTLEEMLLCWLSNENPAYRPFAELIHDDDIRTSSGYEQIIKRFTRPEEGADSAGSARAGSGAGASDPGKRLLDLLQEPARRSPDSLKDQLAFMVGGDWNLELPADLVEKAAIGGDLIIEENQALAARSFVPGPPPPPPVPDYLDEPELEQFSHDVDWMPRVVMVAKNAFVWLDQLSKKYERPITRLDAIPEEELEQLSRWGFTALWLIGVWQRSAASRVLKHRTGNPDAEASAYSLYDYVIADELGGDEALDEFRKTCRRHGIRLSADMVPNHTGIESKWVTEHPDWFIQLPYPPYPSYSYSSDNLGADPNLVIQVEDGYYDQSDAAVTFRRVDRRTSDERFIYHGNDGTSMPWNDTAQLDFSRADVREAVIQTILHVARQFPIIRFDAAMVLTRKNFRRLWYPAPGTGGGVSSRAEHGLSRDDFDSRMPVEFWREVVDRVAEEVPDTLLLAEAFWMLEGYFVRTLGMHRVYNSAFMHMLKNEDNAKYREVMRSTLAFEPEVLKRYVNFMSNPDEETAIEQFGDGDKFFGVSTVLVTMPGLPMIAHGQVEGLAEKYGMEYRRALRDEPIRVDLVERFEREISPLIRKRYLFAEVSDFFLFDFELNGGTTDENVFAYSNVCGEESALVVFNNRYERTSGRVAMSTRLEGGPATVDLSRALKLNSPEQPGLSRTPDQPDQPNESGQSARSDPAAESFVTFRDMTAHLEYVLPADDFFERGLRLTLDGYQHHVFTAFEVTRDDNNGTLAQLAAQLEGSGVNNLEAERTDILLGPIEQPLTEAVNAFLDRDSQDPGADPDLVDSLKAVRDLSTVGERFPWPGSTRYGRAVAELEEVTAESSIVFSVLVAIQCLRALDKKNVDGTPLPARRMVDRILLNCGLATDHNVEGIGSVAYALHGLARLEDLDKLKELEKLEELSEPDNELVLSRILDRVQFAEAFIINDFDGTTYYNKERFELGLASAFCLDVLTLTENVEPGSAGRDDPEQTTARCIVDQYDTMLRLRDAHDAGTYSWNDLTT